MTTEPDDELVPVSVRLGEVVPPEDPEDWTRPLTWVAALGMLAGPLVALFWFTVARPVTLAPEPATLIVAAVLAAGAATTGATQQGRVCAWTATLGAGLFAALVVVALGVMLAGERPSGDAPPATVAQATNVAILGLGGTALASVTAATVGSSRSDVLRFCVPAAAGVIGALGVGWLLA